MTAAAALGWLLLSAPAVALPDVDTPVRTGESAPADGAVVIGLEDYTHIPDVPFASADAAAFYRFLVYTRGVPTARIRLLDRGASREMIVEATREVGEQVGPGGVVWFYFAGHGAASPETGERLLLGDDVRVEMAAFEARAVPVAEVERLATAGGGQVLLVLDTCYSGKGRGGSSLGGRRFAVPSYAAGERAGVAEWSAAGPSEWSAPLDEAGHGAFTYAVLGAMRGWADGQIDGTRDGVVTLDEAGLFVEEALRTLQVVDQRPVLTATDPGGWVLARGRLQRGPELLALPSTGARIEPVPEGVVSLPPPAPAVAEPVMSEGYAVPIRNVQRTRWEDAQGREVPLLTVMELAKRTDTGSKVARRYSRNPGNQAMTLSMAGIAFTFAGYMAVDDCEQCTGENALTIASIGVLGLAMEAALLSSARRDRIRLAELATAGLIPE